MTPKEVVKKSYEAFGTGDMEALASLSHQDMIVKVNGMMPISGQYNGFQDFLQNMLARLPVLFTNFKGEPKTMFAEDGNVFTLCELSGDGFAFTGCHYTVVENEKVKEFHIFDDTQKLAHAMKAV